MNKEAPLYRVPRDFCICDTVGFCSFTVDSLVNQIFDLPLNPISATINLVGVPGVVNARENIDVASVYDAATMVIVDGAPIVRSAKKLGLNCERCAAPDIMGSIFAESVNRGCTHYFYGGKNSKVLKRLRENLEMSYPGINIVGMYSPPFRPLTDEEDAAICAEINELHPDFVWVGIGAPKQEIWMQEHREKIGFTVMAGVGAGFDYIAGTLDKSPKWMESVGLEWCYRLYKEPKRLWKRYVIGGIKWLVYNIGHPARLIESPSSVGSDH